MEVKYNKKGEVVKNINIFGKTKTKILYEIKVPGGRIVKRLRSLENYKTYKDNRLSSIDAKAEVFSYDKYLDKYIHVMETKVTFIEWLLLRKRNMRGNLVRCY